MERLVNCNIVTDIEYIEHISFWPLSGEDFEILFSTGSEIRGNYKRHKLIFKDVWDFRCSNELVSVGRDDPVLEAPIQERKNNIFTVENSKLISDFTQFMSSNQLKYYFLYDNFDSIVDILATGEPELLEAEDAM
ncbi:MAG: hypothetical protein FWE08_01765 [Oscillospiraceae bacterium]|nr:hypothetical protein [Oscillospiraceae bacterium]